MSEIERKKELDTNYRANWLFATTLLFDCTDERRVEYRTTTTTRTMMREKAFQLVEQTII